MAGAVAKPIIDRARVGLSNLHQVLPAYVHITRRTVRLVPESPCWVDAAEVEQQLSQAGIRERREGVLTDTEAQALTRALDLYRGDFLEGFYVPDSRAFEDWAELERERLRRMVIEALHHLVLYDLEHGVYADGIAQATRLLALDPLHEEINRHLILLLAQAGQRSQALAQYEAYCRLLDEELGAKPPPDLVALYRQIQAGGAAKPVESQAIPRPAAASTNPYKGLRPFLEADAADFFGREALVQRLLARLGEDDPQARFLAVVGPSGCGKSSVVRAGLLPALRQGAVPGSERWQYVTVLPGTHPLDELAIALRRLSSRQDLDIPGELERDTRGLLRVVKQVLPDDPQIELVLLIDQFEEVFSLVADESARRHFLDSLLKALCDPHSRLRTVVTLRADFYDRPLLYPELGEWVRQHTEVALPLTPEELEQAITRPAARVGVEVEPALVTTIVAEVNEQPGARPLLQYALTELFERREDHTLTLDTYRAAGGVRGALAARADALYAGLAADEQTMVRQVFLRLVQLGEGSEDTRRRVPWKEIIAVTGSEATAHTLVDRFVKHRLLTLDHDPATGGPTVELAHEALIREWHRFHTWIDESRADLRQQRLLAVSAEEWHAAAKDRSYLLSGARLVQFEDWATTTDLALTPDERDFLDTSRTEHRRQQARRRRVRNAVLTTATCVSVVMTLLALVALQARATVQQQRDTVRREAAVNRSLVLANAALQVFEASEDGPGYALPLALEAVAMDQPPPKAVNTLRTIAQSAGTRTILRTQGNAIKAVAIGPDSRLGLSGGCAVLENEVCTQGELVLWDLETGQEIHRFEGHTGWVNGVAFSPDGKTILSGSDDQTLILWEIATGAIVRRYEGYTGAVKNMALSPDGQMAVSGAEDGTVRVWDVASGEVLYQFPGTTELASEVAFSPNGTLVASSMDNAVIVVWDVATGQELYRLPGHSGRVTALAFKLTESSQVVLMASATDNRYFEWDVATGRLSYQTATNTYTHHLAVSRDGRVVLNAYGPHTVVAGLYLDERLGHVEAGAISPDGRSVLLGHTSGMLRLCDLPTSVEVRRFEAEAPLFTADISADGRTLLTGSLTGKMAILWDLETGQEIRRYAFQEDSVWVEFGPDGRLTMFGSADSFGASGRHTLALVDLESGQEVHRLEGIEFPLRSMAFSPDGSTLLGGTLAWGAAWPEAGAGELILWDVETGAIVRRFPETRAVMGIAFSPDGRRAVTTSSEFGDYISLWDVTSGQLLRRFEHVPEIQFPQDVVWEPDGNKIIVGGTGSIGELDVETGEVTRVFRGLKCNTFYLDHSPDWHYLAAGDNCTPGVLMVWDLSTGEEVEHFTAHDAPIWNVLFNPNGQTVFTSSMGDKPVIEWRVVDWPLDQLLAWVDDNRYIREFTCEERAQYQIEPLCE